MSVTHPIHVLSTGSFAPSKVVTNEELSLRVDTSHEWIVTRSGIHERRIAQSEQTSDMAAAAAKQALDRAGLEPSDIDLLIIGTLTPDMLFPTTACLVQHKLGLRNIPCMDIDAACSGFLYTMEVARAMLQGGVYKRALVIGAEKLSSIVDWDDRATCVLFGDGAGAAVLERREGDSGLYPAILGADGSNGGLIHMPAGGSARPATAETVEAKQHFLRMNGKEVFKVAVRVMENACRNILEMHGFKASDLKCVIPHQANIRIIESLSQRLEISMDRFFINLDRYGNTSAASVPLALDEAVNSGAVSKGDLILMVAFGAGLTYGSSLLRWQV